MFVMTDYEQKFGEYGSFELLLFLFSAFSTLSLYSLFSLNLSLLSFVIYCLSGGFLFLSTFVRSVLVLIPSISFLSVAFHRLVGLVVRRPPRGRKVPGSNPACAGIFSGSSHTSDLKIDTPVATLPGAWRYRISTGTGRPGVSIL